MHPVDFVSTIRAAQRHGASELVGRLSNGYPGHAVLISNLDGSTNGNVHDVLILSPDSRSLLGRAYLGSGRRAQDLSDWPHRLARIDDRPTELIYSIEVSRHAPLSRGWRWCRPVRWRPLEDRRDAGLLLLPGGDPGQELKVTLECLRLGRLIDGEILSPVREARRA